ncbi:DUF4199 domain-containing protein [Sphingomonas sp.]|jgi:hypothetical protein|uniref:DUF4199 domain-containing protein n=1 Tax=Sphingomonas sp. TaxID=28214 RepID=UPI002E31043D|nr:DUF4199 domain-containing protein [Sphingomonas sp.]HEX4695970.1 DUF4199 domain-containing protein [Sphingomonas sp.]
MNPTLRYSLIYGLLAGAVLAAFVAAVGLLHHALAFVASLAFGYAVMLVAMSFIFVGVKRYRDLEGGGVIRFWRAFGLGLLIALIAGIAYALVWEAYLAATHYAFMDEYIATSLAKARGAGKSAADIAKMTADFDSMRAMYANPLYRLPMTFMEVAPVGLLVALFSAALLRNPRLLPARG